MNCKKSDFIIMTSYYSSLLPHKILCASETKGMAKAQSNYVNLHGHKSQNLGATPGMVSFVLVTYDHKFSVSGPCVYEICAHLLILLTSYVGS